MNVFIYSSVPLMVITYPVLGYVMTISDYATYVPPTCRKHPLLIMLHSENVLQ